ncbi:MAG: glycerophosphodiester phosphodiesterase [Ktedonobacteraceae bacterium]|nr:glycerophosphodiester phosphodiesterase [Chloroflexota bacterium]
MNNHIQRVAHRGGAALAPENTLAAFRHARALSVDAIELDVQMSCDGQVIVFHDYTVEKLTGGQGNILDLDFAYLRSLDAAAHFPGGWPEPLQIPTLREVLDLARGHVQVYIEIKPSKRDQVYGRYPGIVEAVVGEVRTAGMLDQVLIISFDWFILPLVKMLEPVLPLGALVSEDTWDPHAERAMAILAKQATDLGCTWINLDCDLFTEDMPATLHAHGLKLGLWTVDSETELRRFARAGVDSLTTNRPDLFTVLHL